MALKCGIEDRFCLLPPENIGCGNSGSENIGRRNSGGRNNGDWNSGYGNIGSFNSGNWNNGSLNSGDVNYGSCNSGCKNNGDYNSGMFNSCNYSSGVFCNKEPKIKIFNIESNMTMREFKDSIYYKAIYSSNFCLIKWVQYTEEEKEKDPNKKLLGGHLKKYSYKEACANWWAEMSEENKEIIKSMPNFDKEIFEDITGIEV